MEHLKGPEPGREKRQQAAVGAEEEEEGEEGREREEPTIWPAAGECGRRAAAAAGKQRGEG